MEKHFFWAGATIISVLILTLGFGQCSQDSEVLKAYKACLVSKVSDCVYPWEKPKPEASPK